MLLTKIVSLCKNHEYDIYINWIFFQCGLFNDPRDERCPRCRTWSSSSRQGDNKSSSRDGRSFDDGDRHHRNSDREGKNKDADDGHYGPPSSGGSRRGRDDDDDDDYDRRPRKKTRDDTSMGREWPPHFESAGASFLFDARSGMFYEPSSDFFYDPKTKLYYSNKKQQYFRYDEDKKPHAFRPIGEATGASGQPQGQVGWQGVEGVIMPKVVTEAEEISAGTSPELNATETKPEKLEPKPKIAISLKTTLPQNNDGSVKSLNKVAVTEKNKLKEKNIQRKESALSTAVENNATPATLPQAHKKHANDMNKWSEREKEMRDEGKSEPQPPASKKVKTTVSGQPICVLCRRKFANLEKLQHHENLSALHKENLAKKAAADAAAATAKDSPPKEPEMSYRDRSKERRNMYGSHAAPEFSHAEALLAHSLGSSSSDKKHTEVIRPEETLNDTNVGNQLLQKLGWKSGEVLGRVTNQYAAGNGGLVTKKDDVASNLKSDWERIESLAQRGGGSGRR
mmetsp:Transcript_3082/g.6767  ORF Transcript_3082/g.6767 Transcript_3082/m.6767 type:complete len:511 (+) Transcript_3082:584-2116(+)